MECGGLPPLFAPQLAAVQGGGLRSCGGGKKSLLAQRRSQQAASRKAVASHRTPRCCSRSVGYQTEIGRLSF